MVGVRYNFIYEKLVMAEDDLVGLIAYGIYKKHKIEFITSIKETEHRDPTEDECRSFFATSTTPFQLDAYRSQAETMLSEMVGSIADEEFDRYEREMLKGYKKDIASCLPSNWTSFGISILSGIVSAFLFAVIAGLFYFIGETSDRSTRERTKELMEEVAAEHQTDQSTIDYKNQQ